MGSILKSIHTNLEQTMRRLKKIIFPFALGTILMACAGRSDSQETGENRTADKPNIIFILVDDLGYGDIGCLGQEKIRTPHIDRMAAEGIRFTEAYAGNAVCAPCRSSLMQGLHPGHARVRGNMINDYRESLREGDFTVAMMLQEAGYKTGLFGKWGLGAFPLSST